MKIYVLDPGHGGADVGCVHNGIVEALYAYRACEYAADILRSLGYVVIFTHLPDQDQNHRERARVAVDNKAVGTISVHVNSGSESEHGPLAFYQRQDMAGMAAAQLMIKKLDRQGFYVNGSRVRAMKCQVHVPHPAMWSRRVWYCLEQHMLPVALLECEYSSHLASAQWLKDNVALLAETIAAGCEALG